MRCLRDPALDVVSATGHPHQVRESEWMRHPLRPVDGRRLLDRIDRFVSRDGVSQVDRDERAAAPATTLARPPEDLAAVPAAAAPAVHRPSGAAAEEALQLRALRVLDGVPRSSPSAPPVSSKQLYSPLVPPATRRRGVPGTGPDGTSSHGVEGPSRDSAAVCLDGSPPGRDA